MKRKDPNKYPAGTTAASIKRLADFYDRQSDANAAHEISTAEIAEPASWMRIPTALVPQVQRLITRRRKSA